VRHRVQPAEPFVPAAQVPLGRVPGGEGVTPAEHGLRRGAATGHVTLDDLGEDKGREGPHLNLRVLQAQGHLITETDEITVFGAAAHALHHREAGMLSVRV
jgi:hypothetical protein